LRQEAPPLDGVAHTDSEVDVPSEITSCVKLTQDSVSSSLRSIFRNSTRVFAAYSLLLITVEVNHFHCELAEVSS
jgi:hypothetical protein